MPIDNSQTDPFKALALVTKDEILHLEYGNSPFRELGTNFFPLLLMIRNLGDILNRHLDFLPELVIDDAYIYATEMQDIASLIISHSMAEESSPNGIKMRYVIEKAKSMCQTFLAGKVGNANLPFLEIYSTIRAYDSSSSTSMTQLADIINQLDVQLDKRLAGVVNAEKTYQELNENAQKTIEDLNKKSSEKVIEQYAKIFENEALRHNENARLWLFGFAFCLIIFLKLLPNIDEFLPLPHSENGTLLALEYLRRLLVVSFGIYVLTFLLKQYTIQKHLETLNTHRQNVFNSFELFVSSLSNADSSIRHSLMVEVARAISDAGQTGYVNLKGDNGTNSIMEVTKLMKQE